MSKIILLLLAVFSFGLIGSNSVRYSKNNLGYTGEFTDVLRGNYEGWLSLRLQISIDPTFDQNQRDIIMAGLRIFLQRSLSDKILNCAFNSSYLELPVSRSNFEVELASAMTPFHVNGEFLPAFVFISRYWGDSKSVILSHKSLFYDTDVLLPGYSSRHYFHVALNSDHLGSLSRYYYREDPEYWAGVLARGFLRNLGYDDTKDNIGSFMNEYGRCVSTDGVGR